MSKQDTRAPVPASVSERPALLAQLAAVVGPNHVLWPEQAAERISHIWNPAPLQARALVRPADTGQVSAVLTLCHAAGQSVVTHGGVTGLVEGERSTSEDIVLSLERMRAIESIDSTGRTLCVQAGCVLETVQQAALEAGLQFCLDLGARGSCTIGGNIATNAGGLSVLRYGMTREQILGLEVVLADGTVLSSMNHMLKNNAGYDLKHLFIGSEGTLGIITRAVLRLRAATLSANTALIAFEHYKQVTATLAFLDTRLSGQLSAFEVIWPSFYRLNTDAATPGHLSPPLGRDYSLYAIVEARGCDPERDADTFEQALVAGFEAGHLIDAVIARSEQERRNLWGIRELLEPALSQHPVFVYDISLPIVSMQQYLDEVRAELQAQWPAVTFHAYGHLADGNLHLLVCPLSFEDPVRATLDEATRSSWHQRSNRIVYTPLQALGGSVSAEHGIGLAKKPYLALSRTPNEIIQMQRIKHLFDPLRLLNPGKIVD